jgi:hypothetical protein
VGVHLTDREGSVARRGGQGRRRGRGDSACRRRELGGLKPARLTGGGSQGRVMEFVQVGRAIPSNTEGVGFAVEGLGGS